MFDLGLCDLSITYFSSTHPHWNVAGTQWRPSSLSAMRSILDYRLCHEYPAQLHHIDLLKFKLPSLLKEYTICTHPDEAVLCYQQITNTSCLFNSIIMQMPYSASTTTATTSIQLEVYESHSRRVITLKPL